MSIIRSFSRRKNKGRKKDQKQLFYK